MSPAMQEISLPLCLWQRPIVGVVPGVPPHHEIPHRREVDFHPAQVLVEKSDIIFGHPRAPCVRLRAEVNFSENSCRLPVRPWPQEQVLACAGKRGAAFFFHIEEICQRAPFVKFVPAGLLQARHRYFFIIPDEFSGHFRRR